MTGFNDLLRLLLVTVPDLILVLLACILLVILLVKPFGFLCQKGIVLCFGTGLQPGESDFFLCGHSTSGYGVPIQVRLATGLVIVAHASPCSLCMERLKPGDAVRVSKIGKRYIAQKTVLWRSGKC